MKHIISAFLLILILPCHYVVADELSEEIHNREIQIQTEKRKELEFKQKQKEIQKKLNELKNKQGSIVNTISMYSKNYEDAKRKLSATVLEINLLLKDISSESLAISNLVHDLEEQQSLLKKRVTVLYKLGKDGFLETLVGFKDLDDLSHRITYTRYTTLYNAKLVEKIRKLKHEKNKRLNMYLTNLEHLKSKKEDKQKEMEFATQKRMELNELHRAIKKDKKLMEMRNREIEDSVNKLKSKLSSLFQLKKELTAEQQRRKMALLKQKGYLPWPVDKILSTEPSPFGEGIDVGTIEESLVKVVAKGKVALTTFYKGLGNTVVVDHDGGNYSVYANLSSIKVKEGDILNSRDVVGTVGRSGWNPDKHYLYLEIRIGGKTVDATAWLKKIK